MSRTAFIFALTVSGPLGTSVSWVMTSSSLLVTLRFCSHTSSTLLLRLIKSCYTNANESIKPKERALRALNICSFIYEEGLQCPADLYRFFGSSERTLRYELKQLCTAKSLAKAGNTYEPNPIVQFVIENFHYNPILEYTSYTIDLFNS